MHHNKANAFYAQSYFAIILFLILEETSLKKEEARSHILCVTA